MVHAAKSAQDEQHQLQHCKDGLCFVNSLSGHNIKPYLLHLSLQLLPQGRNVTALLLLSCGQRRTCRLRLCVCCCCRPLRLGQLSLTLSQLRLQYMMMTPTP